MNCQIAREMILEVDAGELSPGTESLLGRHLRDCGQCRAAAERVLTGTRLLERELAEGPGRSVDAALVRLRHDRTRSPHRLATWAVAASILIALLVSRPWGGHSPRPELELTSAARVPAPVIEDAGGASVAIFETDDPRITIAWIYEENPR